MELTFDIKEFVRKTKKIILSPRPFYHEIEKEKGWKDALSYAIAIAVISSLFGILELTVLAPVFKNFIPALLQPETTPQLLDVLPAFFMSTIMVVLLGFVWAGALQVWFRVVRLKGTYWDVYKTYIYSRAPLSILGWIPYVGGLFGLYSLYVLAVGMSVHYKISVKKALLLLIVPLIVLFLVQALLFAFITQAPS